MMIVGKRKTIIKQKARITLLPIGIEDLSSRVNFTQTLYHKSLALVTIKPTCLLRMLMIQHIRHGDESISFDTIDRYSEDSGAYD